MKKHEALSKFVTHLPTNGDVELSILKCHLLVEEAIEKIIEKHVTSIKYIHKARLGFVQKMYIARSLVDRGESIWVWGAILQLNTTRNKLAHGLSVEEIEFQCNKFIKIVSQQKKEFREIERTKALKDFQIAAYFVFGTLSIYEKLE